MASITVSATRLRSMFENRHRTIDDAEREIMLTAKLSEITTSDTLLEFKDIEAIAKYFKKPWSYLLLDGAEVFTRTGHDNRTHLNRQVAVNDAIVDEIDTANFMLDTAIEVFPEDQVLRPLLGTAKTYPEKTAAKIRDFLEVSTDIQIKAKDEYAALRMWVDAIQNKGVYVSQRRLRDDTVRAFSVTKKNYAVIIIDTGDKPYPRIFSAIHEYCHVLLNTTGVCDLSQHSEIERYCNALTARILLPDDLLNQELSSITFGLDIDEDEENIKSLSHHFRVSQAALLIRLHDAAILTDDGYARLEKRRKIRRSSGGSSSGGGDYYATAINAVGKKYALNVLGALTEGTINRSDASVLLGVGEHLVSRFRDELSQRLNRTPAS